MLKKSDRRIWATEWAPLWIGSLGGVGGAGCHRRSPGPWGCQAGAIERGRPRARRGAAARRADTGSDRPGCGRCWAGWWGLGCLDGGVYCLLATWGGGGANVTRGAAGWHDRSRWLRRPPGRGTVVDSSGGHDPSLRNDVRPGSEPDTGAWVLRIAIWRSEER